LSGDTTVAVLRTEWNENLLHPPGPYCYLLRYYHVPMLGQNANFPKRQGDSAVEGFYTRSDVAALI
jgi:hypothetical protein